MPKLHKHCNAKVSWKGPKGFLDSTDPHWQNANKKMYTKYVKHMPMFPDLNLLFEKLGNL